MWLFVSLFVSFCLDDSDCNAALIRQISHIKYLFVIMFHETWNLMYYRNIRITFFIGLKFAINLDVMSSSNVFNSLIYVFGCKCIIVMNK